MGKTLTKDLEELKKKYNLEGYIFIAGKPNSTGVTLQSSADDRLWNFGLSQCIKQVVIK